MKILDKTFSIFSFILETVMNQRMRRGIDCKIANKDPGNQLKLGRETRTEIKFSYKWQSFAFLDSKSRR